MNLDKLADNAHHAISQPGTKRMLEKNITEKNDLTYPWGRDSAPAAGTIEQVAEGVYWLRLPLNFSLDHINLWLLEDDDGWTLVDTGLDYPAAREQWELCLQNALGNKPIKRIIATHLHPDHIGLAGWLVERFNCQLWMSRTDFLMCRALVSDTGRPAPQVAIDFYRSAGYNEQQLADYKRRFGNFGRAVSPLPDSYRRLIEGETLTIGGRYWQVIVGNGHSPEHVCLYCPALKIFISGDQVLPRITSNVSVFPNEPLGNPLYEWLQSCHRIRTRLPADLLVLPSHETPFYGLHTRLSQLIEGHRDDLIKLADGLKTPRRVIDCFELLFKRPLSGDNVIMATGETVAHLNYLLHDQQISVQQDADGVNWYQRVTR